jgi:hypothetical protein
MRLNDLQFEKKFPIQKMQPPKYQDDYLIVPEARPKQNAESILLSIQKQVVMMEEDLKRKKKKLQDALDEQKAVLDDEFIASCKLLDVEHHRHLELYASRLMEVSPIASTSVDHPTWMHWLIAKMFGP